MKTLSQQTCCWDTHTPKTTAARVASVPTRTAPSLRIQRNSGVGLLVASTLSPTPATPYWFLQWHRIVKQLANRWWGKDGARLRFYLDAKKPEVSSLLLSHHPVPSASTVRP